MRFPRRYSIAGLMAIVLVVSLALAAMRSGSEEWAGGLFLLTQAVIALAVVGAVCRGPSERAWWLGFALFGWGYLKWTETSLVNVPRLPTTALFERIRPPRIVLPGGGFDGSHDSYWWVGHCLWSLALALVGGGLGHILFDPAPGPAEQRDDPPGSNQRQARSQRRRLAATGVAALVILATLVWLVPRTDPALWAGVLYLLTWGVLGTFALGSVCRRGPRRMTWFGAALFGLGFMVLIDGTYRDYDDPGYARLVVDSLLADLRPRLPAVVSGYPAKSAAIARENVRIRQALDQRMPMTFPDPVPLAEFLEDVRAATRSADGWKLPIHVDPISLQEVEKSMQSPVQINMEGTPLGTTLDLALEPLGLSCAIRDGVLVITTPADDAILRVDHYLLLGHCTFALLAATLGAWLVPLVSDWRGGAEPERAVSS